MLGNRWPHKPPLGYGIDCEAPLSQGLAAFWAFNEGSGLPFDVMGQTLANSVGTSAASWTPSSPVGPALSFNGIFQYVNIGSPRNLIITGPISVAFAGSPAGGAAFQTVIDCRNTGTTNGWEVSISLNGNSELSLFVDPLGLAAVSSNGIADGKWHVFGLSMSSTASNGVAFFRDGAPWGTSTLGAFAGANTTGNAWSIGSRFAAAPTHFYNGKMGWLGVWKRALSATDMAAIAENPWQIFGPRRTQTYYGVPASKTSQAGIRRIATEPPPPESGAVIAVHRSAPAPVVATKIALTASEPPPPNSGAILAEGGPRAVIPRFDGPPVVASAWAESPRPESGVVLARYARTQAGPVPIPPGRMTNTEAPPPYPGSVLSTADHLLAVPLSNPHAPAILIAAEPQPSDPGSVLDSRNSVLSVGSGYHIYSNSGSGDAINYATPVATALIGATTWTSTGLASPGAWMFGIRAFNFNGEEQNLDCAVTIVLDATGNDITNRPLPPTGLRAFATPNGSIRVEWYYPSTRGLASPLGFRVYLGTGGTPNYATPTATVLYSAGHFNVFVTNIVGLSDGTTYTVGVRAYNGSGEEQNTIAVSVTADAIGPAAVDSLIATAIV